ncbi:DUF3298 domain-containing protein [Effusibacillus dendaii]|uniref:DUF3298 domain-containing protein n=1 Tax=Effusibacillus dendaii TaxID=2743772 RepID=A0A7I8D926_9BACL|nr:DUF3298 domain-containing protein [Effusibacillus dendaii]BCJ85499.1 hypothetical protein skT53_04840 [Effusibacillus dendaii]
MSTNRIRAKMAASFTAGVLLTIGGVAFADHIEAVSGAYKFVVNGIDKTPPDYSNSSFQQNSPVSLAYNGRAYVSIRFLSKLLGLPVDYDESNQAIQIGSRTIAASGPLQNVTIQKIDWQSEDSRLKISYPHINGLPDQQVQDKINALLKQQAQYTQNDPNLVDYTANYEVKLQKGNLVTFLFNSYVYTGGAHGMPDRKAVMVNLETGETYQMKDLFQENSEYLKVLSDLVRAKDTDHRLDIFKPFPGVTEQDGFYVTDDGVVVYFYPYEHTPYAYGFPEYKISFDELKNIIDTQGSLWKSFNP